ncbi:MAG: AraC family transcriptional regulator [Bacillota bacterium]|nr:AraC family transcriptional regulator [Bacillota bacterium]
MSKTKINREADICFLPQITYFVHRQCTSECHLPRTQIDFHDLAFIISGKGEYIVDDVPYPVTGGDLIYIKPGSFREASANASQPMQVYAFNMHLLGADFEPTFLPLPTLSKLDYDPKINHLLERIKQYFALRESICKMQTTALLMEIFTQVLMNVGLIQGSGSDPRVHAAAAYVMENISRHISAAEIGKAVGVHPGYLNKLTMKHTGKTVSRFITSIRVNLAEDAIVYEGISVSQAAIRFGFSDIYHFSKVFKKYKGYPPSTSKILLR